MREKSKCAGFEAWPLLGEEDCARGFVLHEPAGGWRAPIIYSSPHSGRCYPADFVREAAVPLSRLRATEDFAVDLLFAAAPGHGCPLLAAQRPRIWLDLNRAAHELTAEMFDTTAPEWAQTETERARAGLGVIPRFVDEGQEIYPRRLRWEEARARIEGFWKPYHEALRRLLERARRQFGAAVLIDCHSMPESAARAMTPFPLRQPDIILGDAEGSACDPWLTETLERLFREAGLQVRRNRVYAGGYITRHYGLEGFGAHAIQIEINRRLYTSPFTFELSGEFHELRQLITRIVARLPELLAPLWQRERPLAAE